MAASRVAVSKCREPVVPALDRTFLRWRYVVAEFFKDAHCHAWTVAYGCTRLMTAPLDSVGSENFMPGGSGACPKLLLDHVKHVLERGSESMATRREMNPRHPCGINRRAEHASVCRAPSVSAESAHLAACLAVPLSEPSF